MQDCEEGNALPLLPGRLYHNVLSRGPWPVVVSRACEKEPRLFARCGEAGVGDELSQAMTANSTRSEKLIYFMDNSIVC